MDIFFVFFLSCDCEEHEYITNLYVGTLRGRTEMIQHG